MIRPRACAQAGLEDLVVPRLYRRADRPRRGGAALTYLNGHFGKGALTGWALLMLVVLSRSRTRCACGGAGSRPGSSPSPPSSPGEPSRARVVGWFGWLHNWSSAVRRLVARAPLARVPDPRGGAGTTTLRSGFPFIALISTVVGWFFVTDFISNGGTWTYIVTLPSASPICSRAASAARRLRSGSISSAALLIGGRSSTGGTRATSTGRSSRSRPSSSS